ncbi:MAG: cation transporter [Clostridia bacterium]|nr:cation transporter [Clostridia bacterium]MBR3954041.1 cation transporter [Clostridia bacterium]
MQTTTDGQVQLQKAMHVSVLNIILNLILSAVKGAAGLLTDCDVLVRDAVHSAADTLCTVLVLSGIGLQAKRPGAFAEKMQRAVIFILALAIAATGIGMAISAFELIKGITQPQPDSPTAVIIACLCVIVKALMSIATARIAKQQHNNTLLADAAHHRSDCLSSLLVLCSVACTYWQQPVPDIIARLLLGCCLMASAISLGITAVRK